MAFWLAITYRPLHTIADSNSCALVIRLRKENRVVALPRPQEGKNLSFQEVFTDVYGGDLDVCVNANTELVGLRTQEI